MLFWCADCFGWRGEGVDAHHCAECHGALAMALEPGATVVMAVRRYPRGVYGPGQPLRRFIARVVRVVGSSLLELDTTRHGRMRTLPVSVRPLGVRHGV